MKILSVSDRVEPFLYPHFDEDRFRDIELILSCGDVPQEYISFLTTRLNIPLYYVRGNHDVRTDGYDPGGCIDLDGHIAVHRGLRIMGLAGSRWYNGNPHQYTERQMRSKIHNLRFQIWRKGGLDIVITHAPPRHIHDAEDQCHRGFKCFKRLIDKYHPRYFIHGHIHLYNPQAQRTTRVHTTQVVNTYGHYIIELKEGQHAE